MLVDHLQKERIQKFKETGDTNYIYKNELDKTCFQHDMAYGDFKDLAKITGSHKVLRNKAFNIAKNPKYNGYQRGLASMVYRLFVNDSRINMNANNDKLTEELHKPMIRTVYSRFKDFGCWFSLYAVNKQV